MTPVYAPAPNFVPATMPPGMPRAAAPTPPPAPRPAAPAALAVRPNPQPRTAPVARGTMAEDVPARRRPTSSVPDMPSPEDLGIASHRVNPALAPVAALAPASSVDWTDLRVRLDRLGATHFSLDKTAHGYRFCCQIPAGPGGLMRNLSAEAGSEAEAVRQALGQAEVSAKIR